MPRFAPDDVAFYLAAVVILAVTASLFWVAGYQPRSALTYLQRNAHWIALNALLVIGAAHALMLAPPPPHTPCVESRHVSGPLTMVVSCDSYGFIALALKPADLAFPRSFRQSRPIAVMIASLLTLTGLPYAHLPPEWFSYVIINFALLLVALMLFMHLKRPVGAAAAAGAAILGTFLVFNDVVKGFVWSAHTQMFNVLTPLICIALAQSFLRRPARSWRLMAATGALLGIGTLAYGSVVICVPAVIAAMALGFWSNRERPALLPVIGKIALFTGAFLVPSLVWMALLTIKNGEYYHGDLVECRHFVWIYDYWKAGAPIALEDLAWCGNRLQLGLSFAGEFFVRLWDASWTALVLPVVALLVGAMALPQLKATIAERSHTLIAALITLLLCASFFGLMGYYRNRLEFNVVLPVIVMMSVIITGLLERMPRKQAAVALLLVVLAAGAYIAAAVVRVGVYL
jgi:hypothetical protein